MAISDINSTKFNNIFVNILVWVIDEDDWATPPLAFEFIDTSSAVAVVCQISKPVHLMRVKWKALPNIGDKLGYVTFLQSTLSGQALFIMFLSTINYKFQKKFSMFHSWYIEDIGVSVLFSVTSQAQRV